MLRGISVTPSTAMVRAGIVTGAMTEMKVTERVENGSGRIVTPAKLTGSLKLKNTSAGDSVKLEDSRTEPVLKLDGFGAERLDPGQEATQAEAVNFAVTIAERK